MGWDSRTVGVPGSSNVLSTALAHAGLRGVVHIFSLAWAWVESTPLGCVVRPVVWWPCCGWRPVHEEELGCCPLEWVRAVVASQGGPPGQLLWGGVLRVGGDSGVGSSGLSGFFRRVLGERRGGPRSGCPAGCAEGPAAWRGVRRRAERFSHPAPGGPAYVPDDIVLR